MAFFTGWRLTNRGRFIVCLLLTLLLQGSIYWYLDQILLAPASSFQVSAASAEQTIISGKAYYSRDRRYMAVVKAGSIEIYSMPDKKLVRSYETGKEQVSYFKWLEDRDLALVGLYYDVDKDNGRVVLSQLNPLADEYQLSTTIDKLASGSKITDVAYSTATNVIYIQVQVADKPAAYRVYRTDANHDLTRIYLASSRVGRIAVLYDEDSLIYDNLEDDTVLLRQGNGSWRVISPPGDKFRLLTVDSTNNIYIARLNKEGLAEEVYKGRLKVGFFHYKTLQTPLNVNDVKI
ncbi:MAG TPA: hypothetical protein PKA28_15955 [Methylomusa anaerophila]|uniref:Dipeptidylpeptidase IV N-terminal domain-containing protein n=1 Tax=Methylomusa anaerophila TaxID=1930071 RepID=A0A348AK74_9FIRM|nr:hypothetical protein [Methylomusa anaerophila]BBB91472.1 hypothetical protein MAMMFC1_02156 [Methylomusa anaerophila]HML89939.1 hypothetical protein [Methylomusa anaerophila]